MRKSRERKRRTRVSFKRLPGVFLSLSLLGLAIYLLGWSPLLSLKEISVTGTTESSFIQSSLGSTHPHISLGEPLARVDVHAVDRAISKNEWVESVAVGRSWIHGTLTIAIHQRQPVASFVDTQGVQRYFDAKGHDFQSPIRYSQIPAINLVSETANAKIAISQLLSVLPTDLLNSAQSFTVRSEKDLEMRLTISGTKIATINWGSPSDIGLKSNIFKRLLTLKENKSATSFDLRDPLSPITK